MTACDDASGDTRWWQEAVVYQIYPRSFADGDGDGVGDLAGVRARLDHVADLGADGIWLSPIFTTPMADNGYDVSDYCSVDPVFGTVADVDRLVAEAHARGIRVLLDWVPNHTSDRHPWFLESRSSRTAAKRDWYYWRDGDAEQPPNNWRAAFGGPAWTWDEPTRQWYLHTFLSEQPELNWGNPEVRAAMHDTLRFWLDRGIDGFRADVIHLIGKDPALPDAPPEREHVTIVPFHNDPRTHELIRGIREVLDSYPGDRMMIGEVNLRGTSRIARYYGSGDELHLVFNFLSLDVGWDVEAWLRLVDAVERDLGHDRWPTWVLSNHDVPRHRTRVGGSEARARSLAVLLLTLRGTPFLYAGEELGLEDAAVPAGQALDPGGRDGCRAPIPWEAAPPHGWVGQPPWLPFAPEAAARSAQAQRQDPGSMLQLYRRLLRARGDSPALRRGSLARLDAPPGVLAYERRSGDDRRLVLVNFSAATMDLPLDDDHVVVVAGDGSGEGGSYPGRLKPESAVVLSGG